MNFRNKLLMAFATLLKHRKLKGFVLLMLHLMLSNGLIGDGEYKLYSGEEEAIICDKYVLKQKLFLNNSSKDKIDKWSSRYFKKLNEYIRGTINPSLEKIKEYEQFRKDLSSIIDSTVGLEEDTILFRGEKEVDVESRFQIGVENKFLGFISTSFSCQTAINFSKTFKRGFIIIIKAKKNTKGIAINGKELGSFKNQHEWLLNENQRYITNDVDVKKRMIVIELL